MASLQRCKRLMIFLSLAVIQIAWAEEPDSTGLKIKSLNEKANEIPGADQIDQLITNNNLRAYSGSTSRWSVASTFNYNGGTLSSPLEEDRPNIAQSSATTKKADLDGNISAKYNLNVKNSLMAGVGIRWIAPLAKGSPKDYDGTRFDVQNPYVQYQYLYNWGIQSVLQIQLMQWTQTDSTALGYQTQFNVDQENMYEIGKTGVSLGASVWAQYTTFNKSGSYLNPSSPEFVADLRSVQSDWQLGFNPLLEYQFTEKLNLRWLVNLWVFEHYCDRPASTFFQDGVYHSVGIGWAVTRDVFLFPSIQFLPEHLAANLTNVGVQATVNLF
jgi:hypothetical protein